MVIKSQLKYFCFSFLIFPTILLISSCQKNGSSYIEGNVIEIGTNSPIPNVYVRAKKNDLTIGQATTDHYGHYKIKYFKGASKNSYYQDVISGEHESVINQKLEFKNNNIISFLCPYSHVRVHIKNNVSSPFWVYVNISCNNKYHPGKYIKPNQDTTFLDVYNIYSYRATHLTWNYQWYSSSFYSPVYNDSITSNDKWDTLTYFIQLN